MIWLFLMFHFFSIEFFRNLLLSEQKSVEQSNGCYKHLHTNRVFIRYFFSVCFFCFQKELVFNQIIFSRLNEIEMSGIFFWIWEKLNFSWTDLCHDNIISKRSKICSSSGESLQTFLFKIKLVDIIKLLPSRIQAVKINFYTSCTKYCIYLIK